MESTKRRIRSVNVDDNVTIASTQRDEGPCCSDEFMLRKYTLCFWINFFIAVLLIFLVTCNLDNTCWSCKNNFTCTDFDVASARSHLKLITDLGPRTAGSVSNEIAASDYLRKELLLIARLANLSELHANVDEQISNYSSFRSKFHVATYNNIRNLILRLHDPRNKSKTSSQRAFLVNCHYDSAISSPGASDAFVNCAVMLEVARSLAKGRWSLHNDIIFLFNGAEESILLASHAFATQHRWASDVAAFMNLEGAGAGQRLLMFQVGPGDSQVLMDAYSSSFNQPYASVFGEDIFQSDQVPSDTDFRIFRDYGLVPGIDLSYVHDGYAYHTSHDIEARIDDGCIEQSGSNLLNFLRLIAMDPRIETIPKLSRSEYKPQNISYEHTTSLGHNPPLVLNPPANRLVYFDILGHKFFVIPWWLCKVFNIFIALTHLLLVFTDRKCHLSRWFCFTFCVIIQLLTVIFGYVVLFCIGYILHMYGCRMSWFANRYNLVGTFVFPMIWWFTYAHTYLFRIPDGLFMRLLRLSCVCTHNLWNHDKKANYELLEKDFFDAGLMLINMVMLVLSWFDKPSSYFLTLWVASSIVAKWLYNCEISFINRKFCKAASLTCVCLMITYHAYVCNLFFEFVIPVMGRAGHKLKPDVLIGSCVFCAVLPFLILSAGWFQATTKESAKYLRLFMLNACLSYILLMHISPYGFPYSLHSSANISDPPISPRYQRVFVLHTNRYFRLIPNSSVISEADSHVLLVPLDVNGVRYMTPNSFPSSVPASFTPLQSYKSIEFGVEELVNNTPIVCNGTLPYCGIATPYPFLHMLSDFYHVTMKPHSMEPKVNLSLVSRSELSLENGRLGWNFSFSVTAGPPHTHVVIRLNEEYIEMHNWSFVSTAAEPLSIPLPPANSNEAKTKGKHYFIFHLNSAAIGHKGAYWESPWIFWFVLGSTVDLLPTSSFFDIAASGIYIDEGIQSEHYSMEFEDFVSRMPPWITLIKGCTVYDHWRYFIAS